MPEPQEPMTAALLRDAASIAREFIMAIEANKAATGWGAAVGARHEFITDIQRGWCEQFARALLQRDAELAAALAENARLLSGNNASALYGEDQHKRGNEILADLRAMTKRAEAALERVRVAEELVRHIVTGVGKGAVKIEGPEIRSPGSGPDDPDETWDFVDEWLHRARAALNPPSAT